MNHWTLVKTAMFMSSGFSAIRWKFGKSFLCWAQLWFISKLLPNIPGTGKASHIAPFPSTIVSSIKCKSLTFYVQGWPFLWTCLFWCWRKKGRTYLKSGSHSSQGQSGIKIHWLCALDSLQMRHSGKKCGFSFEIFQTWKNDWPGTTLKVQLHGKTSCI